MGGMDKKTPPTLSRPAYRLERAEQILHVLFAQFAQFPELVGGVVLHQLTSHRCDKNLALAAPSGMLNGRGQEHGSKPLVSEERS